LGDCLRISSPSVNPAAHPDRRFHLFSIPGFDNGRKPETLLGREIGRNKYEVTSECLLVSKINPRIKRVWYIQKPPSPTGVCSTEFVQLIPRNGAIDLRFVEHFLLYADLERLTATAAQAATRSRQRFLPSALLSIPFRAPSLDEQRRIVALLDRATEIRRRGEAARAKARAIIPALFLDTFGDPATNPKGWPVSSLREHLIHLTSGSRAWKKYYSNKGARFIRVQNVRANFLDLEDVAYVSPPDDTEARRTKVSAGDVVLTITGSPGIAAPITELPTTYYVNQHVALLRTLERLNPIYLSCFINDPRGGSARFGLSAYGQTRPGLGLEEVRKLSLPLPPLRLQLSFAERVRRVEALASNLDTAAKKAEAMAAALSAEIFG
jgi:type I restriction enzyme, S subunit